MHILAMARQQIVSKANVVQEKKFFPSSIGLVQQGTKRKLMRAIWNRHCVKKEQFFLWFLIFLRLQGVIEALDLTCNKLYETFWSYRQEKDSHCCVHKKLLD